MSDQGGVNIATLGLDVDAKGFVAGNREAKASTDQVVQGARAAASSVDSYERSMKQASMAAGQLAAADEVAAAAAEAQAVAQAQTRTSLLATASAVVGTVTQWAILAAILYTVAKGADSLLTKIGKEGLGGALVDLIAKIPLVGRLTRDASEDWKAHEKATEAAHKKLQEFVQASQFGGKFPILQAIADEQAQLKLLSEQIGDVSDKDLPKFLDRMHETALGIAAAKNATHDWSDELDKLHQKLASLPLVGGKGVPVLFGANSSGADILDHQRATMNGAGNGPGLPYETQVAGAAWQAGRPIGMDQIAMQHRGGYVDMNGNYTSGPSGFANPDVQYGMVNATQGTSAGFGGWLKGHASTIAAVGGGIMGMFAGTSFGNSGIAAGIGGALQYGAMGAQVAGPLGAVAGAVGGFVLSIFKHNKELQEAQKQFDMNLAARKAAAEGDTGRAQDLAKMAQDEKELADARKNGMSKSEIAALKAVQAEELLAQQRDRAAQAAAAAAALEQKRNDFDASLAVRNAAALGDNDEVARLQRQIEKEHELAQARADGMRDDQIAALKETQALEDEAAAKAKATAAAAEAARKAAELAQAYGAIISRYFNLIGQSGQARTTDLAQQHANELADAVAKGFDAQAIQGLEAIQQMEDIRLAADLQIEELQKQQQTLQDQLQVQQQQLQAQQQTVNTLRSVVDSLDKYGQELLTGPGTILSPDEQYAAAKSQFEGLKSLAMGGDITAAQSLPDAARQFLEISGRTTRRRSPTSTISSRSSRPSRTWGRSSTAS
jgi:hypothetical protein